MGKAGENFSIISDQNLQVNAKFDEWSGPDATIMSEAGLQVRNSETGAIDQLYFDARNDDKSLATSAPTLNGVELKANEEITLADGGTAIWDGANSVKVTTAEYTMDIKRQDSKHGGFLNIDASVTDGANPFGDMVGAHGILGQTADGDGVARTGDRGKGAQGGGAIEVIDDDGTIHMSGEGNTDYNDYITNGLWGTTGNAFDHFGKTVAEVVTDADGNVIKTLGADGDVLLDLSNIA